MKFCGIAEADVGDVPLQQFPVGSGNAWISHDDDLGGGDKSGEGLGRQQVGQDIPMMDHR